MRRGFVFFLTKLKAVKSYSAKNVFGFFFKGTAFINSMHFLKINIKNWVEEKLTGVRVICLKKKSQ